MKITIIGWYGTETIGDRAILAGLIFFIAKVQARFEIKIGSLYPFFSDRTLAEDYEFYKTIIGHDISISLFNSRKSNELDKAIFDSDIIIMGGGPLMHIDELYMVEYAFKKAKKMGKLTAILGCGIGPLFTIKHKKSVLEIVNSSDLVILRDTSSKALLINISAEINKPLKYENIFTSLDPAVECALQFNKVKPSFERDNNYVAVNLRAFPKEYSRNAQDVQINEALRTIIENLAVQFPGKVLQLIPMHYFHIGNDDRIFLNSLRMEISCKNISVQNTPLSLFETMLRFQKASFGIGMRFHSVVLQTIVSGYNFVLDYTEPDVGKISGFLKDVDINGFYRDRYVSLQSDFKFNDMINTDTISRCFDSNLPDTGNMLNIYERRLEELLCEF